MTRKRRFLWAGLAVLAFVAGLNRVNAEGAGWDMLSAKPDVVAAWKDMRFGMFICWGPVTLTGLEIGWSRGKARPDQAQGGGGPTPVEVYDSLYKQWKPDKFDARQWVKTAQDAGARYMIFLVKHHDGFCLYDTQLTDYRSTGPESAWKVDVLKAVADACHEAGLKLIVYYSQPDWHHPDYRTANHARYIQYLHGQVREILTNYGRIDGLWFDLGGKPEDWDSEALFKMARGLQPWLIINNRCGLPGDFDTPEQSIGGFQTDRPWESCITLGTQWSWKPDDTLKSLDECIHTLVWCAGGDGNLALNTNPMPDGRIEPRQADRFREIGQWLKQYSDSVYGTRGGPFRPSFWGASTRRGNVVYVHVLKWPNGPLLLPPIPAKIVRSSLLTGGTAEVTQESTGITIAVPPESRREPDTIIALELDRPASEIKPVSLPSGSVAFGKKATASEFHQNDPTYGPDKALDDDSGTRWGCNWGTHAAWIEVDLGQPTTFDAAWISEPYDRVKKFELQVQRDAQWQTIHEGGPIGENRQVEFPPVTAQHVRLNLLETTEGPSIWEFQLFAPGGGRP